MLAEKEVKRIKRNLRKYFEEVDRIKNEWDIQDRIDFANRKGKEEGESIKQISIAKNMIKMGLSLDQIAEATELPVEDIIKLKNEN